MYSSRFNGAMLGRRANVWVAILLAVTATLLPLPAMSASAAPPAAASQQSCNDVLFLGARGTSEWGPGSPNWTPTTATPADPLGLGDTVNSAYIAFAGKVRTRRSVDVHSVTYPADGLATLTGKPWVYFADLDAGVRSALTELNLANSRCPDQRIVLAGYSQGAMVMHRVLRALLSTGRVSDQQILARIDTVLLIADGDQVPYDTVTRLGSASLGARGISLAEPRVSHVLTSKLPSGIGDRVVSVCNTSDPVCDFTGWDLMKAYSVHTAYPWASETVAAADQAAANALGVPLPRPRTVDIGATVGVPLSRQLTADVADGRTLEWRLADQAAMPAGVSLDAAGLLSGTPTVAGSVTTRVEVRARVGYSAGPWVPATITWTIAPPPTVPSTVRTYPISDPYLFLQSGGVAANGTLFFNAQWSEGRQHTVIKYGLVGVNPNNGRLISRWTLPWSGAWLVDVPPVPNGTGGMWVATSQGLASFSSSGRVTRVPLPGASANSPGPNIQGLAPLSDGTALVQPAPAAGVPLLRVHPGGRMEQISVPARTVVLANLVQDSVGTIWASASLDGYSRAALVTISLTGQVTEYPNLTDASGCAPGPVGVTDGRVVVAACGHGSIIDPVTHAATSIMNTPAGGSVEGPDARLWFRNYPGCDTSPYCGFARWDPRTDTVDVPVRDFVPNSPALLRARDGSVWSAATTTAKTEVLLRISR